MKYSANVEKIKINAHQDIMRVCYNASLFNVLVNVKRDGKKQAKNLLNKQRKIYMLNQYK